MKKLLYTIAAGLVITACNKPAEMDTAKCEHAGDSIAMARCQAEGMVTPEEYNRMCTEQVSAMEITRDSLMAIASSAPAKGGAKAPKKKTTTTTTEKTTNNKTEVSGKKGEGEHKTEVTGKKGEGENKPTVTGKKGQ